jgi:hypothetical protein
MFLWTANMATLLARIDVFGFEDRDECLGWMLGLKLRTGDSDSESNMSLLLWLHRYSRTNEASLAGVLEAR